MDFKTIIIGAGISGIGTAIAFDKTKRGSYIILEKANELGGTWRDSKYPGVAVDIPSFAYQFSFEPNRRWSRLFAEGKEIHDYIKHCAKKYDVEKHIRYNTTVEKAIFNQDNDTWEVFLSDGTKLVSRYLVAATGIFHQPVTPKFKGQELFKGKAMHTAEWDESYDYKGKRVGIIGTGASAVQIVPTIAPDVKRLSVFQRTPIWVSGKNDVVFTKDRLDGFEKSPRTYRKIQWNVESSLNFMWWAMTNHKYIPFFRKVSTIPAKKNLYKQVKDKELRAKLEPTYAYGCKRPAISDVYYPALLRDNVDLETDGIDSFTEKGILTKKGKEIELDFLIYSTGYKATEKYNFPNFRVQGTGELDLADYWEKNGYQSYNGVGVPTFPNFFLTSGPFSFGLNWYDQLEANFHLIIRVLREAEEKGSTRIDIDKTAQKKHYKWLTSKAKDSLQLSPTCTGANSYYIDARGENSLPSVVTPMYRWVKVRLMNLKGFTFGKN